jgi:hypothetical protein
MTFNGDDHDERAQDTHTGHLDHCQTGGAASLLIYRRGNIVVERNSPKAAEEKHVGKVIAHACVGTMEVGGHVFDTFERLDGFVGLDPRHYVCKMETSQNKTWAGEKRRQIRPWNHGKLNGDKTRPAAILIHPGRFPSSFIGCIGVGRRGSSGNELIHSGECMAQIFALCGGYKEGKWVHLEVKGERPPSR